MRRRRLVRAIGLGVVLAAIATAPSAADWSPAFRVVQVEYSSAPLVANGTKGGTHVGWVEGLTGPIRSRSVSRGGEVGPTRKLVPAKSDLAHGPWIASTRAGGRVVVWYQQPDADSGWTLRARRISPRGRLGRARSLAGPEHVSSRYNLTAAQIVLHGDGDATVVWTDARTQEGDLKGYSILSSTVHARELRADGTVGPLRSLAEAGATDPAPSATSMGDATLVAWRAHDGSDVVVRAMTLADDAAPGPIHEVARTPAPASSATQAFTNAVGAGLIVWEGPLPSVFGRRVSAGIADGAAFPIAAETYGLEAVVDRTGRATLAWRSVGPPESDFENSIRLRQIGANGAVSPLRTLSDAPRAVSDPSLAIDRAGAVTVVWGESDYDGRRYDVLARRITPAGAVGRPRTLSRSPDMLTEARVVANGRGRAMTVWQLWTPERKVLLASRYVAGCPRARLGAREGARARSAARCR